MILKKFFGHLGTILHHKQLVFIYCCKCGIFWQGVFHDMSKFSPTEFFMGVKFYQGDKSPNTQERIVYGYSKAWLHHKGRNKHHFEYWTDYVNRDIKPIPMPNKYIVEMFCDRLSATKTYLKDDYTTVAPLEYFLNSNNYKNKTMHQETSDKLEHLLRVTAKFGEEQAFIEAKKLLK